ncbi:C4-dicarboxylate TRAP transporter substrate-binding protein [Oscillibacter sp.]|uniref:C4-dicarboxylate TRAP transporter substrate-binding protein n=1 Tax=Oscillibacter sp. TaxID=1945593 RepID=UPI00260BF538|nr:C4-dicarboxylate TRAP transporter substrate-binding protein [Oscillibacter sp.]MDD3347969.1 C4-dicarboxylate TRAP transporter substrate-binding protein [Oscillibacter sp.]
MEKMKRVLAMLMIGASLMGLTACGGSKKEEAPAQGGETAAPEAPAEKIVIQVGYGNNPGEPTDLAMQKWQSLLAEKSGGTMELELFPSSQLGSQSDLTDQIVMGEPVISISDASFLAEYGAPEIAIASCPYIYNSWDECWKLTESDWWKEQEALLAKSGIHIIAANYAYGERNIMTTKPVNTIEDMKGLIIRTPTTPSYMKAFEYMGAAPTAMALGDVYTATQQGTVEGMENPMATLYGQAYYEVAKYITLTKHVKMPTQWICNEDFFQGLTPEQQTWLTETCQEAGEYNNQLQDEMIDQYMKDMEKNGVTIIDLSDEERAKFAAASAKVYDDPTITEGWRDGLYDYIRDLVS